jgi:hypothetical protein
MLHPTKSYRYASGKKLNTTHDNVKGENLDLKTDDWVEVRSEKEISDTLDSQGKLARGA